MAIRLIPNFKVRLFFYSTDNISVMFRLLEIPNGDYPSVANSRSELCFFVPANRSQRQPYQILEANWW